MASGGGTWSKSGKFRGGSDADKMAGSPTGAERESGKRIAANIANQSKSRRDYDTNVLKTQYESYSGTLTRWKDEIDAGRGINGRGAGSTENAKQAQRTARVALRELGAL